MMRVGVLFGGRGSEREVSFNSGRTICDHLDALQYTIIPLYQRADGNLYILPWRFLHRGKTSDFEQRLDKEAERITWQSLKERVDFIYIAMHGRFAEDGTLQGLLEVLQIPYFGSKVFASALGMDKIMQKKLLRQHGILVPKEVVIREETLKDPHQLAILLEALNGPYVVKPNNEGSSIGVSIVFDKKELPAAVQKAALVHPDRPQKVLIEEYIRGMEFSCIVIMENGKRKPLPPTEIIPEEGTYFFDYEQKYMPGRSHKFTPARCSRRLLRKIQEVSIEVSDLLNIENIARIDGFVTKDETIVITDPNTLAGMAPSSFVFRQAAEEGMGHTAFINHLIETELSQYGTLNQEKKEITMTTQKKTRVGVLLGGRSHEREISLESGRNIYYKLSPQKYEPIALFVDEQLELYKIDPNLLVRNSTKEIVQGLTSAMRIDWDDLPNLIDFAFIGLHGDIGENGSVQGTLEMLGIPYNGSSVLTSALCMDKYKTAQFLKGEGFDVPNQQLLDLSKSVEVTLTYPMVVKPHDDGCSVFVSLVKNESELTDALQAMSQQGKKYALVEECLAGMELTVGVFGNNKAQALPPSQALSSGEILSIAEKFLPGAGENQTPALLPTEDLAFIRKTIEDAYTALNCKGYARIDCFYHEGRLTILEVNSLPGMTPATCIFHQAAEIGLKPMEFIDLIIGLGFEAH